MRVLALTLLFGLVITKSYSQLPFYYKFKTIQGTIYDINGDSINVDFHSRRKLKIENCKNAYLDTLLRTLTLAKEGRKELEHLLTTSAKITVNISEKVGVMFIDGKYRLIAALTGPEDNQSRKLITDQKSKTLWMRLFNKFKFISVYEENTVEIFRGTLTYVHDTTLELTNKNVKLFDHKEDREIFDFSMDTIKIEDLMNPDMMYKNVKELYYFVGLHEIYHTRPENIEVQRNNGDAEVGAMKLEMKAFKRRKRINKREI